MLGWEEKGKDWRRENEKVTEKHRKKKYKLEKLEKAVEDDETKIQNNIGVAERMMTFPSHEHEQAIKSVDMTIVKVAK